VSQDWIAQLPFEQVGVACARLHAALHAPQFALEVFVFTSQPSLESMLQSSNGAVHVPTRHVLATQSAVETCGRLHGELQPPQFAGSVAVFVSQPFVPRPSQSSNAPVHVETEHPPFTHWPVPLTIVQVALHAPQFVADVERFASQPFVASPSQSSNPGLQAPSAHCPLEQPASAFGSAAHGASHPPQLKGSVAGSDSQPSAASPLQSEKPPVQLVTVQTEATQAPSAFMGLHGVSHAPQCSSSVDRSKHCPSQQSCAV
jgi:hypothetical protein